MDYLLDSLISGCLKAWGQDNTDDTPRISKWLENIFHTIIANDLTLVESAPLLNIHSKDQRQVLLQKVGSEMVLDDWHTFEKSNINQKQSLIEGAANRLRKFLRNEIIRNVIGQRQSALDFGELMDQGKVILINLNGKDRISNDNAQLLGIMLVNEMFRCAKLRDPRDTKKKPFYLYIDEFANFVTRDIARSLEETRKFGLFLTLSHQHLMQLYTEDEYLYASVMTNCKNKIVFGGLSHEDAELMMKEVSTGFMDLKHIKDELYGTKTRSRNVKKEVKNRSWSQALGKSWSKTRGTSTGRTETEGTSESKGTSETDSYTSGSSSGSSTTNSSGWSGSTSNHGDHRSTESGNSSNTGTSAQHSSSESRGRSTSTNKSHATSHSVAHSETQSTSNTDGGSSTTGKSEGVSETYVTEQEEYKELSSRTFWSRQEIQHMETAMIKNQNIAEAFVKVGQNPPKRIDVTRLKEVPFNPRTSIKRLNRFRDDVFLKHPNYYQQANEVQLEYDQRQTAVFGRPLKFDGQIIPQPSHTTNANETIKPTSKPVNDSPFS